jgi:membrane fusion protein (multidrug efflux system)
LDTAVHGEPAAQSAANGARERNRPRALAAIAAGVILLGAVAFGWWWFVGRIEVATADAYVGGDLAQVNALTAGTVKSVRVTETQAVHAGQILVELDGADAQAALALAEANLAKAVRGTRGLYSSAQGAVAGLAEREADLASARAQMASAQASLAKAESELARQRLLAKQGFLSPEALTTARTAVATGRAARDATASAVRAGEAAIGQAGAQLASARARIDGTSLSEHPEVAAAAAEVKQAFLAAARTTVAAPIDGYVGHRDVQVGARVEPGTPLLTLIPLDSVWVDANFKETQLGKLRIGQLVTLTADAYGGAATFHGKIAGLSPATGAAQALLPAQNASGNWIKIVQRLPVRIMLDTAELAAHPLQVGLSMNVTVDVRDQTGPRLGLLAAAEQPQTTRVFDDQARAADARVAAIVAANRGAAPAKDRS